MPPKSQSQKNFFQLVLAYKEGEIGEDEVSQEVIDTAKEMSKSEIEKFAKEPVEEAFRQVVRKVIREEVNVPLEYVPDEEWRRKRMDDPTMVTFSRDQSDDPIGLVPFQAGNKSNRLPVRANCQEFLDLAIEGSSPNDWMADQIRKGRPLAPPWLEMVYVESVNAWYVRGHEGRTRCKTIKSLADRYSVEVPVDLFLRKKSRSDTRRASEYSVSSLSSEARRALSDRVVPQYNSPITSEDKSHIDLIVNKFFFET